MPNSETAIKYPLFHTQNAVKVQYYWVLAAFLPVYDFINSEQKICIGNLLP